MKVEKLNPNFVFPRYQDDCFSNIPNTVFVLFKIKTEKPTIAKKHFRRYLDRDYKNIIVLLIDALGFNQWKKYGSSFALFEQLDKKNHLNLLTSVFPSTTSTALNTISSGLTPAEHGLFEWWLYIKEIDKTIETLPFRELGSEKRDSLLDEKIKPKILFNFPTVYQLLKKNGIDSFSFVNRGYANSAYSKASRKGSTSITFINFSDLMVKLRNQLGQAKGKNYFFVYWDSLDTLSHEYGPSNDAHRAELSKISHLLLTEFIKKVDKKIKQETLLIITADHGQIDVNWKKTIYLNKDKLLMKALQRDQKGKVILPTGGPRGVFLHVKESELENIQKHLENKLKNKADVIKADEAIALGLFGQGKIKQRFKNRLGNLTILVHDNHTIWRKHQEKQHEFLGHHGGLSKEEMLIPFAICNLGEVN